MEEFSGKIIESVGLHARPASVAVSVAEKYASQIFLVYKDNKVNMKSIIQIMKLSVPVGAVITVQCVGIDEVEAKEALESILKTKKIIE